MFGKKKIQPEKKPYVPKEANFDLYLKNIEKFESENIYGMNFTENDKKRKKRQVLATVSVFFLMTGSVVGGAFAIIEAQKTIAVATAPADTSTTPSNN